MTANEVRTTESPAPGRTPTISSVVERTTDQIAAVGSRWGLTALRVSIGLIMISFGALKFFPGVSPAEPIATKAVGMLSFGLVTGPAALIATAIVEVGVGLLLVSGRLPRVALVLVAGCIAGWMSPLVLFPGDLFTIGGPTLEAQYLIKDVVFAAAALAITASAFRRPTGESRQV